MCSKLTATSWERHQLTCSGVSVDLQHIQDSIIAFNAKYPKYFLPIAQIFYAPHFSDVEKHTQTYEKNIWKLFKLPGWQGHMLLQRILAGPMDISPYEFSAFDFVRFFRWSSNPLEACINICTREYVKGRKFMGQSFIVFKVIV